MSFSVLVVCTGNICRSPMAQGLLTHRLPASLKKRVSVSSAGTHGLHGNPAEPLAVRAVAAEGVDIREHRARILTARMIREADLVLAMENFHLAAIDRLLVFRCKYAFLLGTFDQMRRQAEIEDPYGLPFTAYETAVREMSACMPGLIGHIEKQVALRTS